MNEAKSKARRSDALYYSSDAGVTRRWLCDKVANLEAENAKLCELVSDFWTDMNTCHLNGDVPNERDLDFYKPRVHEFGITDMSERELGIEASE